MRKNDRLGIRSEKDSYCMGFMDGIEKAAEYELVEIKDGSVKKRESIQCPSCGYESNRIITEVNGSPIVVCSKCGTYIGKPVSEKDESEKSAGFTENAGIGALIGLGIGGVSGVSDYIRYKKYMDSKAKMALLSSVIAKSMSNAGVGATLGAIGTPMIENLKSKYKN